MKYLQKFERIDVYSRIESSKLEEYLRKVGFINSKVRPTYSDDFYISVKPGKKNIDILTRITEIPYLQRTYMEHDVFYFLLQNDDIEDFINIITSDDILREIDIRKYNL